MIGTHTLFIGAVALTIGVSTFLVSEDMLMQANVYNSSPIQSPSPRPTVKPTLRPTPKPTPKPSITTTALSDWHVAKVSEYGGSDGFYYGHFACGGVYLPGIYGTATVVRVPGTNRIIPCGTKIQFLYHGRTVTVRVVDRGPYCCGRTFDLTIKAAQAIKLPGIGTVKWRIVK